MVMLNIIENTTYEILFLIVSSIWFDVLLPKGDFHQLSLSGQNKEALSNTFFFFHFEIFYLDRPSF